MTQDVDFDATVDEVKKQIRDLEDPDYQALLEGEKSNKDRKTVKEFIQERMDNAEVEIEDEEDVEDELVEEIEEETRGGLLGNLSPELVLTAGIAGGLVLGLLLGMVFNVSGASAEITPQEAEDRVSEVYSGQFQSFEVTDSERRSGMYYLSTNITREVQPQGNSTEPRIQSIEQSFYLTSDGRYLFAERTNQFTGQVISPVDVQEALERNSEEENTGNTTDSEQ